MNCGKRTDKRVKTIDEILCEQVIDVSVEEAYRQLLEERARRKDMNVESLDLGDVKKRHQFSKEKRPLLKRSNASL